MITQTVVYKLVTRGRCLGSQLLSTKCVPQLDEYASRCQQENSHVNFNSTVHVYLLIVFQPFSSPLKCSAPPVNIKNII